MAAASGEPPAFFDPFSPAEAAARDVIESILTKGGKMLYDAYIERRTFPFATKTTSQQLVSELLMCYVRYDPGEVRPGAGVLLEPRAEAAEGLDEPEMEQDSWAIEPEPPRCRIDTWARSVVPIKKRITVKKEVVEEPKTGRRRPSPSSSTARVPATPISNRPPSGMANHMNSTTGSQIAGDAGVERRESAAGRLPVPLVEEHHEDEEEASIREMKDREAKRKTDEEVRVKRKVAEESQEAARLAQVQDQMKNKPFAIDSNGDVIWVQAVEVQKLPTQNPTLGFSVKKDQASDDAVRPPATGKPPAAEDGSVQPPRSRNKTFKDTFKKGMSVQPSVFEHMSMAPGVELTNRSGKRKGNPVRREPGQPMSRKEYEDMCRLTGSQTGYPEAGEGARASSMPADMRGTAALLAQSFQGSAASGQEATTPRGSKRMSVSAVSQLQEAPAMKPDLIARPPETPRPKQPAPPPSARRLKHGAIMGPSLRERVPTGTSSRFPNCAPPPVLGATMGHGLVKSGNEEFYFPPVDKTPPGLSVALGDEQAVEQVSLSARSRVGLAPITTPRTPRTPGGSIVSKKPDLLHRYFPPSSA